MKSDTYDPPPFGEPPPQSPYQPYPSTQNDKTSKKEKICVGTFLIVVFCILSYILYVCAMSITVPNITVESFDVTLNQGEGNLISGCLFTITNDDSKSFQIEEYWIQAGIDVNFVTLDWPEDGNQSYNVGASWDPGETIGFDAPPELQSMKIVDGDEIYVIIHHLETDDLVFSRSIVYKE